LGIVSKQASTAAIFSYTGIIIGFVNLTLLMANWFTPVQLGLREILLTVAVFGSQIGHLGTYRSIVKFYPFFKSDNKYDNGLLRIGLIVPLFGFLVVGGLMILFKEQIIAQYIEKSPLFIEYFWFCFPLLFLLMYNNVFESYLQARSKTAYSVFLKSILTRLFTTVLLCLFYIEVIDFYGFIVYFNLSYVITIVLFITHLYKRGEFSLKSNPFYFTKRIKKVYYNYSAFSILSGASSVLVNKMDALMIASFLGLASTSVYVMAVYLSALIAIPGDSIARISMPLLSSSWKRKRIDEIKTLYQKTSATQYLLGGIILLLMWSSIENFYQLQRPEYAEGKYVFLILGLAKLVNMMFGVNGQIISVSKFYRFDTTTAIVLGILTVATNYIFIPKWGIEGAAIATGVTIVGFNLVRFVFVIVKLKLQPFTGKTIIITLILTVGFVVNEFIPHLSNIYFDSIIRTLLLGFLVVVPAFFLKVSEDLNHLILKNLKRIN
jgi:O-antigen/teichoic acid export membrane protein